MKPHSYAETGIIEPYKRVSERCVNTPRRDRTDWSRPMPHSIAVPLTFNQVALVDEEDLPLIHDYRWRAAKTSHCRFYYAVAEGTVRGGTARKTIYMHRLILGARPGQFVDHINGNTLDNRRSNLRFATSAENAMNRGLNRTNRTGYKGVSFHRRDQVWEAWIRKNGKGRYLGRFSNPEDAARAYDMAALQMFGEFARLNFPELI